MVSKKRGKTVGKHIQLPVTKNSFVMVSKENGLFGFKVGDIVKVIKYNFMFILAEKDGLKQIIPKGYFKPC